MKRLLRAKSIGALDHRRKHSRAAHIESKHRFARCFPGGIKARKFGSDQAQVFKLLKILGLDAWNDSKIPAEVDSGTCPAREA